jgi:hypothetical protein
LLADPRVDPAVDDNEAFRCASSNSHGSVVKFLLADPRVDPAAENNDAIRYASFNGHVGVVTLLLEHPQVVVTKAALTAADEGDHEDIVGLMFERQPQVILELFESATPRKPGGSLESEVHQREKASALTLSKAHKRTWTTTDFELQLNTYLETHSHCWLWCSIRQQVNEEVNSMNLYIYVSYLNICHSCKLQTAKNKQQKKIKSHASFI